MNTMRKTQHQEIELLPGDTLAVTCVHPGASLVNTLTDYFMRQDSAVNDSQQRTYIRALGNLVGVTDVEAVARANEVALANGWTKITTRNFRLWLPKALSGFFGEVMEKTNAQ